MEKLYNLLLDLDSDEGIRVENYNSGKKIYVNRNGLGIYKILIRTMKKSDNKDKEENYNSTLSFEGSIEEIVNFDNASHVIEFLKHSMDRPTIWLY